jgi:hypothetical protein
MGSHVMDGESASFGKEVGQDATNNVTVAYCTSVSPPCYADPQTFLEMAYAWLHEFFFAVLHEIDGL